LAGTVWISKEDLEERLMEKLSDKQYAEWISCMDKIAQHSEREKEITFLKGYRKNLTKQTKEADTIPVILEPDGRKSCYVPGKFNNI
jgi:hypothetical protein